MEDSVWHTVHIVNESCYFYCKYVYIGGSITLVNSKFPEMGVCTEFYPQYSKSPTNQEERNKLAPHSVVFLLHQWLNPKGSQSEKMTGGFGQDSDFSILEDQP